MGRMVSRTWVGVLGRVGVISVTVLLWGGRAAAEDDLGNPTPNQLIAYCEAEWNRFTDNGYWDVTGWKLGGAALNASTEDLRSGVWLPEVARRTGRDSPELQALGACLSRGVLAGRNHTFRTPSMTVRTRIDNNPMGRQDPVRSKRPHQ